MKNIPILLKRETWEHPSFYTAPMIIMGIILLGALGGYIQGVGGTIGFSNLVSGLEVAKEGARAGVIFATFFAIATVFQIVLVFVIFFYLLDALYSERKQRHILFWKSMPITDTETVLSKALTATFVIPLFFFAGVFITKLVFLFITSIFILVGDGSAIDLVWKPAPIFADFGISMYAIIAAGLWMLPFTGWLLLSSSIAKKGRPFMWAILLPMFVIFMENIIFGTKNIFNTIATYLVSYFDTAFAFDDSSHELSIESFKDLDQISTDELSLSNLIDPFSLISSKPLD